MSTLFEIFPFEFAGEDEASPFSTELNLESPLPVTAPEKVCWIQNVLNKTANEHLAEDGVSGPLTRAAVLRFQTRNNLLVDGIVGPQTETALIQAALNQIALASLVPVNGVMDARTRQEIQRFQGSRGLVPDGIVGPKTRAAMIAAVGGRCVSPRAPRPRRFKEPTCGVPERTFLEEITQEFEITELERSSPSVAVRPKLSFFQNAVTTSHRNHFHCGALRQARRISAIESPDPSSCALRVGDTAYDTGADIIASLAAASLCLGERALEEIHIFSHAFDSGIIGRGSDAGLYQDSYPASRAAGGRTVRDIATGQLANGVVFVLHGCNTAAGTDNFARSLFERLAASLSNPKVFGHHNSGCSGRNNSWREYSNSHPTGLNLASLPNIASTGCCGT